MYTSQELSSRIKEVARENNVSIGEMLKCCGLSVNTLANMNNGRSIAFDSLAKIADYLNTSIDELVGRTPSITYGNVTGNESGNAGNTNCSFGASADCSEEAKEIDQMLKSLSFKDRAQLMNIIVEFVETHKK